MDHPVPDKPAFNLLLATRQNTVLTVQPLGVVLQRPFKAVLSPSRGQVVKVGAEDDGVRLGEFCVRTAVEAGQLPRVPLLHPHSC